MKVDLTNEVVFGFDGPNLCLLGNEDDFRKLSECILDLTNTLKPGTFNLRSLDFVENEGIDKPIIFSSQKGTKSFAVFNGNDLIFELDPRVWERLFRYFVQMSWYKRTYYLNAFENCLDDLDLVQECYFICSSEF